MRFVCPQCRNTIAGNPGEEVECSLCRAKVPAPADRFAPGTVIGDFAVVRELGRGGNGVVYLARQISLDRPVALKVLQDRHEGDSEFVDNFIREARAAAKISHPNIVQAYAVGEEDGIYYFAMEYIDGETMKQVLKREGKVSPRRAAEIVENIAEAVDCAWNEQHLVHQDIKPDNIMLTKRGQAKLADLGLARIASNDAGFSDDEDEVMGTPQYISPEQLTGVPTDVRSDIYSLGASFYHMVTGRFPYVGKDGNEIARQHVEGTLTQPISLIRDLPSEVNRIIVKMMEKDISRRYQSAREVADELRKFLQGGDQVAEGAKSKLGGVNPGPGGLKLGGVNPSAESKLGGVNPGAVSGAKLQAPAPGTAPEPKVPPGAPAGNGGAKPVVVKPSIVARPTAKPAAPAASASPTAAPAASPSAPAAAPVAPAASAAPAAPASSGGAPAPVKPPEKKAGMSMKNAPTADRSAPPMVAEIGRMMTEKPPYDFTILKKVGKILLIFIVVAVIVAVAAVAVAYILDQKNRVPEQVRPYSDKLLVLLTLKKAEAVSAGDGAAGVSAPGSGATPPAASTAGKTPPAPPKPSGPPKPVTRQAYLSGVDSLLSFLRSNPEAEMEFLEKTDAFLVQFPQPHTPEERTALSRLLESYGKLDNRLRMEPHRKVAMAEQDELAARRRAEADAQARAEAERRAAQQAALADLQKRSAETAEEIAKRDRELREMLARRTEEYRVKMDGEQRKLAALFLAEPNADGDQAWQRNQEQLRRIQADLPVNATAEERKILSDTMSLADSLNIEYARYRTLYGILNDPKKLEQISVEIQRRLLVLQEFKDGVFIARTGRGDRVELPMSSEDYRRRVLGRLERKFELPGTHYYYSLLRKEFDRLKDIPAPNDFLKQATPKLIEQYRAAIGE